MNKFTDGPWTCCRVDIYRPIRNATVARVGDWVVTADTPSYEDHGTSEADAKLIAQAPAMLDQLHLLATLIRGYRDDGLRPDEWTLKEWEDNIRAVIAAATGE